MSLPIFKSFFPSVRRWMNTSWRDTYKVIVDNETGAPIGLTSQNANGPQGIWAPTPLSSDQIASPTSDMLADLNATYQLNEAPYSRYRSDGVELISLDGGGGTVIPPGVNDVWFSPLVITQDHPVIVQGGVRLIQ